MTVAKPKTKKVEFLGNVSYGFKRDTPGHEGLVDQTGTPTTSSKEFVTGDTYEFHENEFDVVDSLIEQGLCKETD